MMAMINKYLVPVLALCVPIAAAVWVTWATWNPFWLAFVVTLGDVW